MSLFEFFATQTDVAAAQAAVNVSEQKLTTDRATLLQLQREVDPNGTMGRQVAADATTLQNSYIAPKTAALQDAVDKFTQWSEFAFTLNNVVRPGADQTAALQSNLSNLAQEDTQLEQAARMHRRRFLDNFPQEGAGTIPYTSDNLAMIAFFVGFAVFFAGIWLVHVPQFSGKMIVGLMIGFLLYWVVSHTILKQFGTRDQPS
jgi:hypothetical protein